MNGIKQVLRQWSRWPGKPVTDWNDAYRHGRWSYLRELPELGHYSVIAGYVCVTTPTGAILDIGCGEGLLCRVLPPVPTLDYTGIDLSSTAINIARTTCAAPGRRFICTDFGAYQPDQRWNAVIFNESLYYAASPRATLERYASFLKPQGVFIISMYLPRRAPAWKAVDATCKTLDQVELRHTSGNSWWCCLAQPKT